MAAATTDIVSTQWLKDNLNKPEVCVLDVTWYSSKNAHDDYVKEHIPNAVYFDLFKDANNTPMLPRNVPEAAIFEKNARCAGVNNDSHVIVYDAEGMCGYFLGSRAWWTFQYYGLKKVSVLDGGLQKWKADGFALATETPQEKAGNFTVAVNTSIKTSLDFMKENLGKKNAQILDSRASDVYKGKQEDTKSGHYPSAVNIPFGANLLDREKGTFKSKDELKKVFEQYGVNLDEPIVTMCNSGMSSCSLLLAARILGSDKSSVFQGGFTEWKNNVDENMIERS